MGLYTELSFSPALSIGRQELGDYNPIDTNYVNPLPPADSNGSPLEPFPRASGFLSILTRPLT